jgi:hypothetical protein
MRRYPTVTGIANGLYPAPVNPSTSPLVFKMVPGATAPSWDQDGCSYANEGSASGTTDASGNPTLATLFTISPVGVAPANAFGTASVAVGLLVIATGIASTTAFGTASLVPGAVANQPLGHRIDPGGVTSTPHISPTVLVTLPTPILTFHPAR